MQAPEVKTWDLHQVASAVKKAINQAAGDKVWRVRAEIQQVKKKLGEETFYLELVDNKSKMKGLIWAANGRRIMEEVGREEALRLLSPGNEVIFDARVSFHERFGLSLHIERLDLRAMLGAMERRKQATIGKLKRDGLLAKNGSIVLPNVLNHVALIGSPETSGFRDFASQVLLVGAPFNVALHVFESKVQGADAPASLARAIGLAEQTNPDLIVIVRGGGSKMDLEAFNDLELALTVANSSCPVWTGIGHETDLSVADMVAHRAFKTPTEAGSSVIQHMQLAWDELYWKVGSIGEQVNRTLGLAERELALVERTMKGRSEQLIAVSREILNAITITIGNDVRFTMQRSNDALLVLSDRTAQLSTALLKTQEAEWTRTTELIRALHPQNVLARGFAIVRLDGKAVKLAGPIASGSELDIELQEGRLKATVTETTPHEREEQD